MDFSNWKWLNESQCMTINGELAILAPPKTDWFNDPVPEDGLLKAPVANALFFYTEVTGDFVFRAKVRPNHRYVYDACALMVIQDEYVWAKAAFEQSDFGTKAAVCVATNQISDDANGCNIEQEEAWLQIVRVGDVFCTHYSLDGKRFDMVRLFHLPVGECVKVGLEAQSPAGEGGLRFFSDVTLEMKTVGNLRAGM
ncbi:MAG: DUF1349 domain-containing protein [Eubacterium sp.]|nr:DUF1349 domain-containing protein [Eubacterium sp.]MBQ6363417.1 DUF1349 domain-containing protein [Lachnospiraceae bacterium]